MIGQVIACVLGLALLPQWPFLSGATAPTWSRMSPALKTGKLDVPSFAIVPFSQCVLILPLPNTRLTILLSNMRPRMSFDDVAWEQSETIVDAFVDKVLEPETLRAIVLEHRRGVPIEFGDARAGTFNISLRMTYQDGGAAVVRFPKPGASMFPEEKVRNEVATIRYTQDNTSIPVPSILHWGTREESPLGLGPFIIMEYIKHDMNLCAPLNTPGLHWEDRPILDPRISIDKLEMLYRHLADILVQLSTLSLPRVGSLEQLDDISYDVTRRPLPMGVNELVRLGSFPRSELPNSTYSTALSYFEELADLHMKHLDHQRNDAVDDADDCRRKFVARYLFRRLAKQGKLNPYATNGGPFKLCVMTFGPLMFF